MHTLKETISVFTLLAGAVLIASCSKGTSIQEESRRPIVLTATVGGATKAPVITADTFHDYTIWLSAYLDDTANRENTGDYFTGEPFNYTPEGWKSAEEKFWPFSGTMDFLAISADADLLDVGAISTWGEERNADGVLIRVPEGKGNDTEILYARSTMSSHANAVGLNFYHTQMLLRFSFTTHAADIMRLDAVTLRGVLPYGDLLIRSDSFLTSEWDLSRTPYCDCPLPGIDSDELSTEPVSFDVVLPAQKIGEIKVDFHMKASATDPWGSALPKSFTFSADDIEWVTGKVYTFNTSITATDLTVAPVVEDWITVNRPGETM